MKLSNVISHWDQLIENFQASSQDFYRAFEAATEARAVPEIRALRVEHKEGGLASANREYLRLHRGKHAFDICAAPYGTGFFVSWWFTEPPLRFGFLYMLGFLFALLFLVNIVSGVGFAIGMALSGVTSGVFMAGCATLVELFGSLPRGAKSRSGSC